MSGEEWPGKNWSPDRPDVLTLLETGEIEACDLLQQGSNYVFVLRLDTDAGGQGLGIYKPLRGEAPLWDYPSGLYKREVATYLVSRALGWGIVPPTVIRDGPHGAGSTQLFIEHNPRITFFELRDDHADEMQRMAAFDALVNNGDRKGGHCLLGVDGRIWGIDHGLTFHLENKLRTVIWDYAGDPIPESIIADLARLQSCLGRQEELVASLRELITRQEIGALRQRLDQLLQQRRFPKSGNRRSVPWPPV
ncbi:MAG: SCO1664 family protein [Dehalococcoidia bacterium]